MSNEPTDESLYVSIQDDGRIEVEGLDMVVMMEADDGLLNISVFAQPRSVLLGLLRIGRDGVEVVRTGEWRGTLVEWTG